MIHCFPSQVRLVSLEGCASQSLVSLDERASQSLGWAAATEHTHSRMPGVLFPLFLKARVSLTHF